MKLTQNFPSWNVPSFFFIIIIIIFFGGGGKTTNEGNICS